MKNLLFIPFFALLGSSCNVPHYVTTPTLNAPQARAFTPTRKNAINANEPPFLNPENNQFNFTWSIDFPANGTQRYINLKTGETLSAIPNSSTATEPTATINLFWRNNERRVNFWGIWNKYNGPVSLAHVGTTEAPEDNYTYLYYHLTNFDHPNLTPVNETGNYFVLDQSILNISGTFTFDPHIKYAYDEGHYDGYEEGLEEGVNAGLTNGREEGFTSGYSEGYENGLEASRNAENLTIGNYYTTITLFPDIHQAVEIAKTLTQDGVTGLVSWAYGSWKLLFQAVDFPAGSVPYPDAKNLTLSFVFDTENVGLKVYSGLGTLGVASTQVGYIDLRNLRSNQYGNTWLYSFDPLTWGWNTPESTNGEQKVFYAGNPINISIRLGESCYNKAWKFYQYQLGNGQTFDQYNAEECTRALLGGAGTSYADGFAQGNENQIKAQSTYRNVFKIFTPAFVAVGSFFNMSIGPFKMWYFFVIPLMITALVLFIKLVKH